MKSKVKFRSEIKGSNGEYWWEFEILTNNQPARIVSGRRWPTSTQAANASRKFVDSYEGKYFSIIIYSK